jgi:hypothetical protein
MTKNDTAGYKRPPAQHRFPPGTSGNPAGRPKGRRSFLAELADELHEIVDGEITKQKKIIRALVEDAIRGEARALALLLSLVARTSSAPEPEPDDGPEDKAIAESFAKSRKSVAKREIGNVPPKHSPEIRKATKSHGSPDEGVETS